MTKSVVMVVSPVWISVSTLCSGRGRFGIGLFLLLFVSVAQAPAQSIKRPVSAQTKARASSGTLAAKIASVLPTPQEERWLQVPWRMDLVQARAEAQRSGKPLFLWIME